MKITCHGNRQCCRQNHGSDQQSRCCDDTRNIDLALREALANAIVHGNRSNPDKAVRICVAVQPDCGILIIVKDTGIGFGPSQLPNPVVGQNLLAEHGRGIFLVNQLMDDVRFTFDGGTSIHMRRNSTAASQNEQFFSTASHSSGGAGLHMLAEPWTSVEQGRSYQGECRCPLDTTHVDTRD